MIITIERANRAVDCRTEVWVFKGKIKLNVLPFDIVKSVKMKF